MAGRITRLTPLGVPGRQWDDVSGSAIAQTLPRVSQAAVGKVPIDSAIGQLLPAIGQSAAAKVKIKAAAAQSLPRLTQNVVSLVQLQGSISQQLPPVSQILSGIIRASAAVSQQLPAISQTATATTAAKLQIANTLRVPTQSAAGVVFHVAVVANTLPKFGQSLTARLPIKSQASSALPRLLIELVGQIPLSGLVSQTLKIPYQTGEISARLDADIHQILPFIRQSLTGSEITDLGRPRLDDRCHSIQCGPACEWIFSQIHVFPKVRGGTHIEWVLHPQFSDPGPYRYQIQVGRTGSPYANDWVFLEPTTTDSYFIDLPQRVYGKFQWTHYRVLVTTGEGVTYASKPQPAQGAIGKRDWLRAKEIVRLERLRLSKIASESGFLLKRRHFGTRCECRDLLTEEVREPDCEICYGTGIVGGYFAPYPCFLVELGLNRHRAQLDLVRGSVDDDTIIAGRMINEPQVYSYDVFVSRDTDFRWLIHNVESKVEIRGTPLVLEAELRQLPFSHIIYQFPVQAVYA